MGQQDDSLVLDMIRGAMCIQQSARQATLKCSKVFCLKYNQASCQKELERTSFSVLIIFCALNKTYSELAAKNSWDENCSVLLKLT